MVKGKAYKSKAYVDVSDESGNESECPLAEIGKGVQPIPSWANLACRQLTSAPKEPAPAMHIEPLAFRSPA
jgi:hypothetical protein